MQGYAGPVQQGDMVVRANEVSPGITSLLAKQNRRGARGIYELPSAKQPIPNYYNMALGNVQNEIRSAARMVNAMAPEGERLAYVNPEEEGILKLLGGAGEPQPVTGIPSYFRASQFSAPSSPGTSSSGGMRNVSRSRGNSGFQGSIGGGGGGNRGNDNKPKTSTAFTGNVQNKSDQQKMLQEIDKALAAKKVQDVIKSSKASPVTSSMLTSPGSMAVSPETGGRQAYYAVDPASAMQVAKAREAAERAVAGTPFTTAKQAVEAEPELETFAELGMEGAEKEKGFFEKLFDKIGQYTPFGMVTKAIGNYNFDWYLENIDPDMGKKFKQLSEKEQQALRDNPYLIPGYQDYWDTRREQAAAEEAARQSRGGDGPSRPAVTEEVAEEEVTEEEELPYFSYYRRFKQPMTYEDIIKRAFEGAPGPLLETFEEAKEREQG